MKNSLVLYYVGTRGINLGDSINPVFFERILGMKVKRGYPTNSDVVGIGSLMQMLTMQNIIKYKKFFYLLKFNPRPIFTLSTGFRNDFDVDNNFLIRTYRKVKPVILRGVLSHKTLEKINKQKYDNVSYGDLGLLFPYLLNKKIAKKYKLGIVPHKYDYNNPIIGEISNKIPDSVLIDLRRPPMETLEKIAECETIISSSLHGLIVADSMNIPNKRIKLSNLGLNENSDFKFDDYYSIYSNSLPNYISLTQENYKMFINDLSSDSFFEDYCISYNEVQKHQENLYKVCLNFRDMVV